MLLFKNIIITGQPQTGKSELADWLLEQLDMPYAGLRTTKLSETSVGPTYQLQNILSKENIPISCCSENEIRQIPATFNNFGTKTLKQARTSLAPILLLDEIGDLEQNSPSFLTEIFEVLDSDKIVIAVLKKEELPYLAQIKARADALLIDLDLTSHEAARKLLTKLLIKEALM